MSPGFEFRGLRCFVSENDPALWEYVPLCADVQRDENHTPILVFVDLGPSAYLLFTARWEAQEGDLEALREELATRTGTQGAGHIRLSFAPVGQPQCNLQTGDVAKIDADKHAAPG